MSITTRWRSSSELEPLLKDLPNIDRLALASGLSDFASTAILETGYQASSQWDELIILTDSGKALKELILPSIGDVASADISMSLFEIFSYHDILIDWQNSNLDGIIQLLNKEMIDQKLKWPYIFGRTLYDKFNNTCTSESTDHLTSEESRRLIDSTPPGIFQIGTLLSGPFGLIRTESIRFMPPAGSIPLWHCSDTGCSVLHTVDFIPDGHVPVERIFADILRLIEDHYGPSSEWESALRSLHHPSKSAKGCRYYDLSGIIADCILNKERTLLLEEAIGSKFGHAIRQVIGAPPRKKSASQGPAYELAERMNHEEQLQLLLLLSDSELIRLIDKCVKERRINIPVSEVRETRFYAFPLSDFDSRAEVSSLGVRSVRSNPIQGAFRRILSAYSDLNLTGELDWRLRKRPGLSTADALMDYISQNNPSTVVSELILSSQGIAQKIADELDCQLDLHDETTRDRIAWKFGFNLPRYEEIYARFRRRIEEFNEAVLRKGTIRNEDDREYIRKEGVNIFVSVEEILSLFVSYNVWLLGTDHFVENRFEYDPPSAIIKVGSLLGSAVSIDEQEFAWKDSGDNTLGILLVYLQIACKWMSELSEKDRTIFRRPEHEFPRYSRDPEVIFPFNHKQLWADADRLALSVYVDGFQAVARQISQANLPSIRNGLDHKRDETRFPTIDSILACIARLKDAFEVADSKRYIPKSYWLERHRYTRFGAYQCEYKDYKGTTVSLHGPKTASGILSYNQSGPIIIPPGDLLGRPNSQFIFRLKETSSYSEYWKGYPRIRKISPKSADDAGAGKAQEARTEGTSQVEA